MEVRFTNIPPATVERIAKLLTRLGDANQIIREPNDLGAEVLVLKIFSDFNFLRQNGDGRVELCDRRLD